MSRAAADLDTVIDSAKLGPFQISVIALCALVAMIDGFDTQVIGLVAPAIAADWKVSPATFGLVFSSGLFSGMIGAFLMGQAGDRWGRKPVLIAAILVFALGSLATLLANTVDELILLRVITGFGLGGALPIIISITAEFSPKRYRTNIVALMYCGFPLGSATGGFISAYAIPTFGWQSVFLGGGVFPLLLLPFLVVLVPESARFLAVKGKSAQVEGVFRKMGCDIPWNGVTPSLSKADSPSVASLFAAGRAPRTLLIWTTLFLSLLLTVFLASWMPLLARQRGLGIQTAVMAVTVLNIGAIIGGFTIGRLCDRLSSAKPIAAAYALGAVAIALIGVVGQSSQLLLLAAFVAGMFTVGAQMTAIALSSHLYETSLRSTGVGWAFGVGRIGAVVGPIAGGLLIGAHIPIPMLFLIAGAVALCAALAVYPIRPSIFAKPQASSAGA
ncbi:MAG TPA: MFS transporter [Caulobacteraceae bacterium]|nr:MFS transporter [Caulobacteraceae bacterium]